MSVDGAGSGRSATRTFALFQTILMERLHVLEDQQNQMQEQLHNHTYMLKELLTLARIKDAKR